MSPHENRPNTFINLVRWHIARSRYNGLIGWIEVIVVSLSMILLAILWAPIGYIFIDKKWALDDEKIDKKGNRNR